VRGNRRRAKTMNTNAQKAQIARINRSFAKTNEFYKLCTSRGWREVQNLGDHHVVDTYRNAVVDTFVSLDELEASLTLERIAA
jgi:hypothetical protein